MLAASKLFVVSRGLLARASGHVIIKDSRATYIRGHWPEPITQSTLDEFLSDINYFEEPKKFVNIGPELDKHKNETPQEGSRKDNGPDNDQLAPISVDNVLDLLSEEAELPPLDLDDLVIDKDQLVQLAVSSGIYRDLFGQYQPDRGHITFTPEQAKRLYKLVPYYWITDQPFARVARKLREPDPLYFFEPTVRLSARFVQDPEQPDDAKSSHTSYHGNLIPACEAKTKPSISIDGCWSSFDSTCTSFTRESQFDNWEPGRVTCENVPSSMESKYQSLLLLNLDSIHPNSANLHWMVTNVRKTDKVVDYEEACDYLPVHGIRGFGYSRYVFLALQHDSKLDIKDLKLEDFRPETRKFDTKSFLEHHKDINMLPIGMSWFQTVWDESSNDVFHNYMNMKAPVYEHVQQKLEKMNQLNKAYPGKIPFHIFMDHHRDPKEIEERVLLMRLSNVNPFDYKDQYVKPRVPPTVFTEETENSPSWMHPVLFKKHNRIGVYRGLRPASATLPLNNNADLDKPARPILSTRKALPGFPNLYPAKPRIKRIKDLPYSKPANDQSNVYVQEGSEIYLNEVKKSQ